MTSVPQGQVCGMWHSVCCFHKPSGFKEVMTGRQGCNRIPRVHSSPNTARPAPRTTSSGGRFHLASTTVSLVTVGRQCFHPADPYLVSGPLRGDFLLLQACPSWACPPGPLAIRSWPGPRSCCRSERDPLVWERRACRDGVRGTRVQGLKPGPGAREGHGPLRAPWKITSLNHTHPHPGQNMHKMPRENIGQASAGVPKTGTWPLSPDMPGSSLGCPCPARSQLSLSGADGDARFVGGSEEEGSTREGGWHGAWCTPAIMMMMIIVILR